MRSILLLLVALPVLCGCATVRYHMPIADVTLDVGNTATEGEVWVTVVDDNSKGNVPRSAECNVQLVDDGWGRWATDWGGRTLGPVYSNPSAQQVHLKVEYLDIRGHKQTDDKYETLVRGQHELTTHINRWRP